MQRSWKPPPCIPPSPHNQLMTVEVLYRWSSSPMRALDDAAELRLTDVTEVPGRLPVSLSFVLESETAP